MTALHQRLWELGDLDLGLSAPRPGLLPLAPSHAIGGLDPYDETRWRLSAAAERQAARSWLRAAVAAAETVEVLACTRIGRTALRQAAEYDRMATENATGR